jgi:hypothetical protein
MGLDLLGCYWCKSPVVFCCGDCFDFSALFFFEFLVSPEIKGSQYSNRQTGYNGAYIHGKQQKDTAQHTQSRKKYGFWGLISWIVPRKWTFSKFYKRRAYSRINDQV